MSYMLRCSSARRLRRLFGAACLSWAVVLVANPLVAQIAPETDGQPATRLAAIFGDNMVLQSDTNASIWGWDEPGQEIELVPSWGASVRVTTDETGAWRAALATPAAGGPHSMQVQGSSTHQFNNILMGEVWLCSGQSNMEMPMKGFSNQPIVDSQEELLKANKPEIRFFKVARKRSDSPQSEIEGSWQVCTPESIRDFSAVGYFFGDMLQQQLNVPVGLIGSYWGGTVIEAWMDSASLAEGFKEEELRKPGSQPRGSSLYNGMIHPLIPYTIKGVIWYQAESNRSAPQFYQRLLSAMVASWRSLWQQGEFPFYYVQVSPFAYDGAEAVGTALLREAQLKAAEVIPNAGMVVSLDHGNCECIHPFNKKPIGERLAYWALKHQYGYGFLQAEGPTLKEMVIEGNQAVLSFDNAPNGLISRYARLDEFEISGENRNFFPATAYVNANGTVTVSAPEVSKPVAVRYAFRNCPEATLFNTEGLPASSFRTDDW